MMRIIKKGLVLLCLLTINMAAFAQTATDPPVGNCNGSDIDDVCEIPLDTWVYLLVAITVIYGAYKMHQKQKALNAIQL
ncbi:hypothetical protein [Mucilaginibacter phyllosphaerae]|uniref:Signal peptidase n=1 Tax=Mucilaginibacter phyllosphaerae TaxID=1812349 RepID=A0A4Y8AGP8_9SPHI|nr:hypothetical protein [Mucilaginibacter phyllosphaerae]MBB3968452.1 hypothetical protein [Mucilaginibacter phyllosphaerae]TEW67900.1 hypothetical protein E2R65_07905 [Mucilaginibacter phyllosphaerae]